MLDKWLEIDTTASWKKLFAAIESPAVTSGQAVDKGDYTVNGSPAVSSGQAVDKGDFIALHTVIVFLARKLVCLYVCVSMAQEH